MRKACKHTLPLAALARGLWMLAVLLLLLTGCATPASKPLAPGSGAIGIPSDGGWWSVHVHFSWPDTASDEASSEASPDMHLDLLVAREIFAPLIEAHRDALPLWRFHRRAVRDAAGHRLRFLFYAPRVTAQALYDTLAADPLLAELHAAGKIESVVLDDPRGELRSDLSATSDPGWSPAMQTSWPYFIMGVSQLWLNLMAQIAQSEMVSPPSGDLNALVAYYQTLDEKITATWQHEGRHALLHHLNALFGYERLPIYLRF